VFRLVPWARTAADGFGRALGPGLIAGNRPEALPAPMSELETPFRFGTTPSGTVVPSAGAADD